MHQLLPIRSQHRHLLLFFLLSLFSFSVALPLQPYSDTLARKAALFSSLAYGEPACIAANSIYNSTCQLPEFTILHTYLSPPRARDAFAYIGMDVKEKLIVVAFKGSNDTEDYIIDIAGPVRYRFPCSIGGVELGQTHHGFCAYYRSLAVLGLAWEVTRMWEEKKGEYTVLVTGHSLGECKEGRAYKWHLLLVMLGRCESHVCRVVGRRCNFTLPPSLPPSVPASVLPYLLPQEAQLPPCVQLTWGNVSGFRPSFIHLVSPGWAMLILRLHWPHIRWGVTGSSTRRIVSRICRLAVVGFGKVREGGREGKRGCRVSTRARCRR